MAYQKLNKECACATRNLEKVKGNSEIESEGFYNSFNCIPKPLLSFGQLKSVAIPYSHFSHKFRETLEGTIKPPEIPLDSLRLTQTDQKIIHYLNMPTQSCLLPLDDYFGIDVVPFIAADQVVTLQYVL